MTDIEIQIATALDRCTFPPASAPKRFARHMAYFAKHDSERELTARQRAYLYGLCKSYRRQTGGWVRAMGEWLNEGQR